MLATDRQISLKAPIYYVGERLIKHSVLEFRVLLQYIYTVRQKNCTLVRFAITYGNQAEV